MNGNSTRILGRPEVVLEVQSASDDLQALSQRVRGLIETYNRAELGGDGPGTGDAADCFITDLADLQLALSNAARAVDSLLWDANHLRND